MLTVLSIACAEPPKLPDSPLVPPRRYQQSASTPRSQPTSSLEGKNISLADIGYTKGVTIQWPASSQNLYFQIDGRSVVPEESYLELPIEASLVLSEKPLVKVMVNDSAAAAFLLKTGEQTPSFRVPIKEGWINPGDEFLKVTVSVHLPLYDVYCNEATARALWVTIPSSAYLHLALKEGEGPLTISQFLAALKGDKKVILGVSEQPSLTEAQGAIWIYAFLKREMGDEASITGREFRDLKSWLDSSLESHSIVIAEGVFGGEADESPQLRLIEKKTLRGKTRSTLVITGKDSARMMNGVKAFLEEDVRKSAFGDFLIVQGTEPYVAEKEPEKERIALKELGVPTFSAEAGGPMRFNFFFSLAHFPKIPKDLAFVLSGHHTPVNANKETVSLVVYLNDLFVKSFSLTGDQIDGFYVHLPSHLLKRENSLGVEFSYLPSDERCKQGVILSQFKGTIDDTSYFDGTGERETAALFEDLPWCIRASSCEMFSRSLPTLEEVQIAGNLLSLYWKTRVGKEIYPPLRVGWLSPEEKKDLIAVLSLKDLELLEFSPPLVPHDAFRVRDYGTGRVLWSLKGGVPLGVLELFRNDGRNILLGTYVGGDGKQALLTFLSSLGQGGSFLGLKGNIALSDGKGNLYSFQEKELKIEYPTVKLPQTFWQKYKISLFVMAWLLLGSFTLFLAFRSRREART